MLIQYKKQNALSPSLRRRKMAHANASDDTQRTRRRRRRMALGVNMLIGEMNGTNAKRRKG